MVARTDQEAVEFDKPGANDWPDRFVKRVYMPPEQLLANPFNYRVHSFTQQKYMKGVLDSLGWLDEIKVNINTDHVFNGHMRLQIALSEGKETVPVSYYNLSEDEERAALATFDPIAQLAATDEAQYRELVGDVIGSLDQATEDLSEFLATLQPPAPIEIGDGDQDVLDAAKRASKIAGGGEELIVRFPDRDTYTHVLDCLDRLRERYNVETNSEAIIAAILELAEGPASLESEEEG